MTVTVFGVKLWVPLVICKIISKLRKKPSKLAQNELDNVEITKISSPVMCCDGDSTIIDVGEDDDDDDDDDDHGSNVGCVAADMKALGLREIEAATNGLAIENRIGSGEFGDVYHGLLKDGTTRVAIKNLFSNRREEKEFCRLAEAMMLIRHKNLVKLLGYCAQGPYRMVVHEYMENGNLDQLLHNCTSKVSLLTWNIRMQIIKGIAKGLAYLHEDTKPPITIYKLKSSNVLVDQHWNPKISDFGTTKLLGPEYDRTHVAHKKSDDVYNFGVLIMEIVSGKTPIQTYQNEIEEHLVDWIKYMVAQENYGVIPDPSLPELPTTEEVRRILRIAIRCVHFEANGRPKMREIVSMLELRGLLLWN